MRSQCYRGTSGIRFQYSIDRDVARKIDPPIPYSIVGTPGRNLYDDLASIG